MAHRGFFLICIILILIPAGGCSRSYERVMAKSTFNEADDFYNRGSYQASLGKYEQIMGKYPAVGDRVLFEMGIIYSHPNNERKDYKKSLECFEKLIREYPGSVYRQDAEMMIYHINNVILKDGRLIAQQTQIEGLAKEVGMKKNEVTAQQREIAALEKELKIKEDEILAQQKKIDVLEQKVFAFVNGPADKILVEKKERRLTLLSKDKVLRTYKIALGGDPEGPKERQGDNKTPEGTYVIDARNGDSRYHLSLHISYPNEKDKIRAKELGVSPGGDIMIHGIKNGLSQIGALHAEYDWTRGCIAVTDEEIEEIDKLAPIGTIIEIRP